MNNTYLIKVVLIFLSTALSYAQAPAFDAASVKLVDPLSVRGHETTGGPGTARPGRIDFRDAMMLELLTRAYDVSDDQVVGGPGWIRDLSAPNHYEVIATMPPNTTKHQFQLMLQNLLAERFRLVIHREIRNFPGYALVVAKGGPKLAKTMPAPKPGTATGTPTLAVDKNGTLVPPSGQSRISISRGRMELTYRGASMAVFAADLNFRIAQALGTTGVGYVGTMKPRVTDRTGLTGRYDFALECSCANCGVLPTFAGRSQADALTENGQPEPAGSGLPNIFAAIEKQLGLRLEKTKDIPLDVIVIDRVDKVPTAN